MSMMSPDLNVTVDANVDRYEKGLERARTATQRYETSLKSLEADLLALERSIDEHATRALQRQHDAMDKTGKAAFVFGAAVAAGLGLAINEAIKWESAWAGVTKTVDGTAPQMGALEDQLRGLAQVLPSSHEEIAAVAEAAGQLGVAREDVAAFTRVAIDLGQTTDLAATDAATSLAQLMNIMGTAPDDVGRLGSTLVELGNNGASTESQIVNMALRVAGAGQMVGASESDVLALSSAMADLGIQSELGGGAIQRTFIKINTSVKEGGAGLEAFADLAGMTSGQFASAWTTDPVRAFDAVIQGMGQVQAAGGNLAGVIKDLELDGTQNLQVLLRMAGAGDVLTESLASASTEWQINNALIEEAAKRYATTESQVLLARNAMRDAGIDIGATLLPVLASVLENGADLIRFWQDLPGPLKLATTVLSVLAATIGLVGGAAFIAIPKIAAFKVAVEGLEAGALKTAGTRLAGLGSFLMGPWGIALSVGVTALGIFAAKQGEAAQKVDALVQTLNEQTGAITDNSRAWVIKELTEKGTLSTAKNLGLNLEQVTDAALGNEAALAAVNAELDKFRYGALPEGMDYETWQRFGVAAEDVHDVLGDTNGTLAQANEKWALQKEAMGDAGDSAETTAGKTRGLTGDLRAGADAAGDLSEEVKTLGEDLEDLSSDYLSNRAAGRAIRDQLREIRRATREYVNEHGDLVGAFKRGTDSADGFAAMLDDLAGDYQKQIAATERLSGSQKATMATYRDSRKALLEVADQLGMTRDQAHRYVEEVLGTPQMVRTHFETPGLDNALSAAEIYGNALSRIPSSKHTTIYQEMQTVPGSRKENGGIVTAYASGGFSFGGRRSVAREPMIARGGANIVWAEPTTGWEAYISGKPGMESRNRDVWAEAGRRLGMSAAGGHTVIERTVVVKQMLPDRLTLSVDGRTMTAFVRGHAQDVASREMDSRTARQGIRARMNDWGGE